MDEKEVLRITEECMAHLRKANECCERIFGIFGTPKESKKEGEKHKIAKIPCKKCGGLISWDGYNPESRPYPIHVDENGFEVEGCYNG